GEEGPYVPFLFFLDTSTQSEFHIHQSHHATVPEGGSVTLSCSFHPTETPLWAWIYWRVGSPSGDYAYHPNKQMVHSSYKGRTELRGPAHLHIEGVQRSDSATYYCIAFWHFTASSK
uniref:Ig-like domain-containing protein n=1 Tax=Xenopus tropicalis TaxID=8364 RepID=A0A6I8S1G5_XENTR